MNISFPIYPLYEGCIKTVAHLKWSDATLLVSYGGAVG